jgi:hypothetical protein
MNTIKLLFASLATVGAFSVGASAQEGVTAAATTTTTSTTTEPAAPGTLGPDVGISSQDGITLSGTEIMVTRNGVTEKLTKEIKLENGTRILPNGSVISSSGTSVPLRPSQVLTFDGKVINAPVSGSTSSTGAAAAPAATTTTVTTPAVTATSAPATSTTTSAPATSTTTSATTTTTSAAEASDIAQSEAKKRANAAGEAKTE